MKIDYRSATLDQLAAALSAGEVSSVELVTTALKIAKQDNPSLGAYLAWRDQALGEAQESDQRRSGGRPGSLEGIPVAVKDNMVLKNEVATASSKILEDYRAVTTATAVQRLREAGAIVIGKTNLDEFAMGSSTENSAYGPAHNPWNPALVPGGSSGGSAVTVAAGHVPVALGSDTGGSIRQPASFCGLVGFKPSYGRVSRSGLMALASSLDQIGPFARTVADAARIYEIMAGLDPDDATTSDRPIESVQGKLGEKISGLRVGLPKEFFGRGLDPAIAAAVTAAAKTYESLGATVTEVSVPHAGLALNTYYVILPAEASSNLARYDGMRYGLSATDLPNLFDRMSGTRERGFGTEVKRRIMIGTYVLSAGYADAYYHQAVHVRQLLREEFHQVFDTVDVLLTPTAPMLPFALGAKVDDPLQMYLADLFTVPANLADIPAISIPGGQANGLPIGIQLMAKRWDEATLLRAAAAFEQATDWYTQHPPRP